MRPTRADQEAHPGTGREVLQVFLARLKGAKRVGEDGYTVLCPAHDDRRQSLSLTLAKDRVLLKCHAGCETEDVVSSIGLRMSDLFAEKGRRGGQQQSRSEVVYRYEDEKGGLLFEVIRLPGKIFRQRRPDPKAPERRISNLQGISRVLYRLPMLVAADPSQPVFVGEGEKDVDNLRAIGAVATTNPGGTGNTRLWEDARFRGPLRGRDVVILPDNDAPGRKHAARVARALRGCARSVKVINLPGLRPKGDVSDWIEAGGTRDDLMRLVVAAGDGTMAQDQETGDRGRLHAAEVLVDFARKNCTFFRTTADEDGARRDLLESVTHGPRGDIVSVYTTFPWPGLCAEIEKLKIELREPLVLDGDAREFATTFATTRRVARNRWGKRATPAGFEPAFSP